MSVFDGVPFEQSKFKAKFGKNHAIGFILSRGANQSIIGVNGGMVLANGAPFTVHACRVLWHSYCDDNAVVQSESLDFSVQHYVDLNEIHHTREQAVARLQKLIEIERAKVRAHIADYERLLEKLDMQMQRAK